MTATGRSETGPESGARGHAIDGNDLLVVNEIFGPTVQGEGPSAGRHCVFLRLGGCNLSCRWCDTPYTWDWQGVSDEGRAHLPADELHPMPRATVLDRLIAYGARLVIISGGEPLSQQKRLLPLVRDLVAAGKEVEIETNGTISPQPRLSGTGARFNVSPKLAHSGDPARRRIVPSALEEFARLPHAIFKFVCRDHSDLDEVAALVERYELHPVWIMPVGRTSEEVLRGLRTLIDDVVTRGWNMTVRLHVLAWETKRGV